MSSPFFVAPPRPHIVDVTDREAVVGRPVTDDDFASNFVHVEEYDREAGLVYQRVALNEIGIIWPELDALIVYCLRCGEPTGQHVATPPAPRGMCGECAELDELDGEVEREEIRRLP